MTCELAEQAAALPSAASLSPYASALAAEAEPLLRHTLETSDRWGLALTLSTRGQLALLADDDAAARRMHSEALDMLGLDAATIGDMTAARDHAARDHHAAAGRAPAAFSAATADGARLRIPDWVSRLRPAEP